MVKRKGVGKLSEEALSDLAGSLSGFYQKQFDEPMSEFRARLIVEYLNTVVGTKHYNKAIEDAEAFFNDKLLDLDATLMKDEPSNTKTL
jgi:uncharacterized protein (DUF2164 family)